MVISNARNVVGISLEQATAQAIMTSGWGNVAGTTRELVVDLLGTECPKTRSILQGASLLTPRLRGAENDMTGNSAPSYRVPLEADIMPQRRKHETRP